MSSVSNASVYLDNSGLPHNYWASVKENQWIASRFTTDNSASSFKLDSLSLSSIYAATPGGGFVVGIYECTGPSGSETLGALVGNLTGSTNPDTQSSYTFTANDVFLNANTSYWMATKVISGSANYQVSYTYETSNLIPDSWTIPSTMTYRWSDNQGASWDRASGGMWPYRYTISATAIPEPQAAGLIGVAAGFILVYRKLFNR